MMLICTKHCRDGVHFERDADGSIRVIVETRFRDYHGAFDQRLLHIYHTFLVSDIRNWIVVLGGMHWSSPHGKAISQGLRDQPVPEGRTLRVLNQHEFAELANATCAEMATSS
jgi:hypothetical protein